MFGVIILLQYESFSTKMHTRGYSMSLKNGVVLLLGQGVVNLVQVPNSTVGKTPPDLDIPTTLFHCRLDTPVSFSLLSVFLHTPFCDCHKSQTWIYQSSTVKCWHFLAHPKRLTLFPILRNGIETATCPLRPLQDTILLTFADLSLALFI